ncbi:MAG: 2-dehydro-3-deoxyphosphogluconate aldolase / (4S)-4-hydroxy-2-oxoglutarate aldolase [Rhodospirillaceae bacterium]|jgi:2-dehydro-3-deoxyphosphogluconate aldolase/(4S)-4-hydroxy-2-oxoglutarate aldolase|nr:2-dehydro-3-deoxyphosphogluconate aldolase / (4S)-4-hydroxy-2-oxoglutarate aldolase [Rhodospirillaceae bacterium]
MSDIGAILKTARVIPVVVVDTADDAVPLARALVEGGLAAIEITLRTPAAAEAVKRIQTEVEGAIVGVGTVTTRAQLDLARSLDVAFAVSPGLTPGLVRHANALGLPYLPGIATTSEALLGAELGCRALKFFPAAALGGSAALSAIGEVLPDLLFCPTGGIGPDDVANYLAVRAVAAVGCSWPAARPIVQRKEWNEVRRRAERLSGIAQRAN